MGQWISMVSFGPLHPTPNVLFNDAQFAGLGQKPRSRFGLPLNQRKAIWSAIVKSEDRAADDAEAKFPIHIDSPGYSPDNFERYMEVEEKLQALYLAQLLKEHRITSATADSIPHEALSNGWAFPER